MYIARHLGTVVRQASATFPKIKKSFYPILADLKERMTIAPQRFGAYADKPLV